MAKIKVRDIKPTGVDLFEDSESFLNEVNNDELEQTVGGLVAIDDASILIDVPIKELTVYTIYTCTCPRYCYVIL
ncbi:MAG: hypothetical protein QNJ47_12045 [Nostocaceae cyanobacterium]|nr:hypothetical protein [Nostocaceae cyanobacterium]